MWRRTMAMLAEQRRLTVWTVLVGATVISLALLTHLGATAFAHWQGSFHRGASMVMYLRPTVDQQAATHLAADLAALAGVARADYVSPQESEIRLRRALSGSEQLLDGIDPSTMPASIELVLEPGIRDVIEVSAPFRALRASSRIDNVEISGEWADQSGTTLSIIGTATTWVSYTFMAIACIVLLLAARLRWERNGSLLAVARLLGGGPGYTRVPAALAAMVVSVVAAGLALTSVWLLHRSFAAQIAAHVATTMPGITIAPLLRDHALATLATAAIIGLLAGSLTGDRAQR
ncbi:MAG: permease-like cell division protein FtsX [Kofleriaceae bacterium]|nr:permease-like cell division protein FtsX [Kofleriaceae bacterium]